MLTNFIILVMSLFGGSGDADSAVPPPDSKPTIEIPKPSNYEKGGNERGGWDHN
ncbi:MAG: hypothetical protein IT258_15360 [Saprospiraceae bacterium]|nr:hypothetical protein [Saprospiraceae bacterium]